MLISVRVQIHKKTQHLLRCVLFTGVPLQFVNQTDSNSSLQDKSRQPVTSFAVIALQSLWFCNAQASVGTILNYIY